MNGARKIGNLFIETFLRMVLVLRLKYKKTSSEN